MVARYAEHAFTAGYRERYDAEEALADIAVIESLRPRAGAHARLPPRRRLQDPAPLQALPSRARPRPGRRPADPREHGHEGHGRDRTSGPCGPAAAASGSTEVRAGRPARRGPGRRRRKHAFEDAFHRGLDRKRRERRLQRPRAQRRTDLARGAGAGARTPRHLQQAGFDLQPGLRGGHPPQQRPAPRACSSTCSRRGWRPERQRAGAGEIVDALLEEVDAALEQVASLDEDRILRSFLTVIGATLRTNFFQEAASGEPHALRLHEVRPAGHSPTCLRRARRSRSSSYSPRVEGVHLRFGAVARGGLRWSDRREDFRTEILGLVKAQMVKNAVIVPVGAKGGFVAKQLPDPSVDRDAWLAEGVASYTTFISAPARHHRQPGRAARSCTRRTSSGTTGTTPTSSSPPTRAPATFSDIANGIAESYGLLARRRLRLRRLARATTTRRWASPPAAPGSPSAPLPGAGRGHPDPRTSPSSASATCPATCSATACCCQRAPPPGRRLRPPAHLHRPDAGRGHRRAPSAARLFELPRSSWDDYDTAADLRGRRRLPRTAKSIPVNAQVRGGARHRGGHRQDDAGRADARGPAAPRSTCCGTAASAPTSRRPTESDARRRRQGQRRRPRRRRASLRVQVVGEGGNLGLTQLGRIEFALRRRPDQHRRHRQLGAGVDSSDHEVNIKILLDGRRGRTATLTVKQRNKLLAQMTDEVGRAGPAPTTTRRTRADRQRAGAVRGHAPRPAALHAAPGQGRPPQPGPGVPALPTARSVSG